MHSFAAPPQDIDLTAFAGRADAMRTVWRYSGYVDMYYRTHILSHSERIFHLFTRLYTDGVFAPIAHLIDPRRIQVLSLVHDDTEIITGDYQSVTYLFMSADELDSIDSEEDRAVVLLAARYPHEADGYVYGDLLREIIHKTTLEAQIVKYLDHVDGYAEALHEIYAGNICFTTKPMTDYGRVPIPPDYYIPRFDDPQRIYPLLAPHISILDHPFFKKFERLDFESIALTRLPHTWESWQIDTDYPLYDIWRSILRETLSTQEIEDTLLALSPARYYDKTTKTFSSERPSDFSY